MDSFKRLTRRAASPFIVAGSVLLCGASSGSVSFRGFGFHNTEIYDFVVEPGNPANRWDSASASLPLTSKQAVAAASRFMMKIPADEGWKWKLSKSRLQRVSAAPEEWIYVVTFIAAAKKSKNQIGGVGGFGTGIPRFDVVVQMNGQIPKPRIQTFPKVECHAGCTCSANGGMICD